MSITLRNTSDTATSQTYDYASKTTPLTSTEVDKNFITLKQKCDELATDYTTTFNSDGSLKDGAVTSVSISDNSVTPSKIKDRSVDWAEQRNIIYLTDTSVAANKVEGTINNYLANSGLTALSSGTVIYFKAANDNTASTTLTVKDFNTTTDATTTLLSLELFKQKDASITTGDIKDGAVYAAFYDGTTLQLVNTLQDPKVEVKESISRVQTFGPIEFNVGDLPENGAYDSKTSGLSDFPTSYTAFLECTTPQNDYAEGDLVPLALASDDKGNQGFSVRAQASDILVARSSEDLKLPNTDASGVNALTPANWKVIVRGTYQNDSTYSPAYVDRSLSYPASYPSSGVTFGDYLYVFSTSGNSVGSTNCPLYKINLVTNKVVYICSTRGSQNATLLQYSDVDTFKATSVSPGTGADAGTGYAVGDVVTLVGGTSTAAATFVVKTITGGGGTGPVGTLHDVTDATVSQNAGTYTVLPVEFPAATTGGTSGSSGLKVTVNFSSIAQARLYWTSDAGKVHYIDPNGSNNPEVKTDLSFNSSPHYSIQDVVTSGGSATGYYGFSTLGGAKLNSIILYNVDNGAPSNASALNLLSDTKVGPLEGSFNKHLECIQWNSVKRRLYVSCRGSNLMHIFSWSATGNLHSLFQNVSSAPPTYVKTIGIPSPAGVGTRTADDDERNNIHVDWDTDTGEEKSITLAKFAYNGTVTRAAWKED